MEASQSRALRVIFAFILAVWTLFALFPIYWTVVTAFKSPGEVIGGKPTFVPLPTGGEKQEKN